MKRKVSDIPFEVWLLIVEYLTPAERIQVAPTASYLLAPCLYFVYKKPCFVHDSEGDSKETTPAPSNSVTPSSRERCGSSSSQDSSLWQCLVDAFKYGALTFRSGSTRMDIQERFLLFIHTLISTSSTISARELSLAIIRGIPGVPKGGCHSGNRLSSPMPDVGLFVRDVDCSDLIQENVRVTDRELQVIILTCPNIVHINLSGCEDVSSMGLLALSQSSCIPNLVSLNLADIPALNSSTLALLATRLKVLRRLNLSRCPGITDSGACQMLRVSPYLERLRIQGCPLLTDDTLQCASEYCGRLEWLDVGECQMIGDYGLLSVAKACPKLQWLNLARTRATFKEDAEVVLNLDNQFGSRDPQITDKSIVAIAENCHELELLDLSYCGQLTDDALVAIGRNCHKMKSLCLRGLALITRRGMFALGELRKEYKTLIWLQIYQCKYITSSVIEEMIKQLNDGWKKGPYDREVHKEVMQGRSWDQV